MVASVENNSISESSLEHQLHQEHVFFNPHLHEASEREWGIYGVALTVFAVVGILSNILVFLALWRR